MSSTPPPPSRARPRWPLAVALVLAVVLFYALGLEHYFDWPTVRANLGDWKTSVRDHLALSLAVFIAVYIGITGLSLPVASIVSLVGGALFGRWLGTAAVSVSATIGATLAFLSSRYILGDWAQERFGNRLAAMQRGFERDGPYYLFTLRLVPLFPFFLINLGMGLTRMRVGTYMFVSWIGMLPGTFLYVYAGEALGEVESPSGLLSPQVLVALALLGIVPLVLRMLLGRKQSAPP